MILPTEKYTFKLLTACFCGGADNQGAPAEMRVPSIRGQIRSWHHEIAGANTMNRIWGSTAGQTNASRVALICDATILPRAAQPRTCILPHKNQGPRPALAADQTFTVTLQRLIGCTTDDWKAAQNAVKLWMLIGCLGLRANRAAGSIWPTGEWVPQTSAHLRIMLQDLGFKWPAQLVDTPEETKAEELRRLASDTVKGRRELFGEIEPRNSSPTKFKVIELENRPRLLVTAPPSVRLTDVRAALSGTNKAGQFMWQPL